MDNGVDINQKLQFGVYVGYGVQRKNFICLEVS